MCLVDMVVMVGCRIVPMWRGIDADRCFDWRVGLMGELGVVLVLDEFTQWRVVALISLLLMSRPRPPQSLIVTSTWVSSSGAQLTQPDLDI